MPAKPKVSPERALEVYLSLPASSRPMSIVCKQLMELYGHAPAEATMYGWAKEHGWKELADKQDQKQIELTIARNAAEGASEAVERVTIYEEAVDKLLARISKQIETLPIKTTQDLGHAVKSLIELQSKADVLSGGISDRTEVKDRSAADLRLHELLERYRDCQ